MKKKISTALLLFSCIFFIVGICCVSQGFDKKDNYYNSEYSISKNVNAYVGGDAYNYIINGTYFSGYFSLGGAMFICATNAGIAGILCRIEKEENPAEVADTEMLIKEN